MSRFSQHNAMSFDDGAQAKALVKWFNVTKGFGFVAPVDGTPDAFLHISVLNKAGLQELSDGTELLCTISQGPKGPQVTRIVEVLGGAPASTRAPVADRYGDRGSDRGSDRGGYGGGGDRYGDSYGGGGDRYGDRGGYGGGGYGGGGYGGGDRYGDSDYGSSSGGPEVEMSGTVKWFKPDKGFGFVTADDASKDVFVHKSVLRRCGLMQLEAGQRVQMRVQDASKGREATWIMPL
ncbi:cold-shock protein [Skermanella stibiiresistens SB22]|uniref:Cold-shock protein n=1 Tax=Skermanella stibiiresistens SB22 TaxID=1385369 RepID=W9H9H5_9PROT|nr:cold shock domain-containing protein [Skermanella stibiiresistens]EWY41401.1 cold-shock protein [Skermanella stibiiresistens SB22]